MNHTVSHSPPHSEQVFSELLCRLGHQREVGDLLREAVDACQTLSGAEMLQLYLLDASKSELCRRVNISGAECVIDDGYRERAEYRDGAWLSYSLCLNQTIALRDFNIRIDDRFDFLPEGYRWRSLLLLPLTRQGCVEGVLLLSDSKISDLSWAESKLKQVMRIALNQLELLWELDELKQQLRQKERPISPSVAGIPDGYGMLGNSSQMVSVRHLIGKVLHSDVAVLIKGDTGTGKELVARGIHVYGKRRTKPLQVLNCASLPENLLESELFGYTKGAFTGADRDHLGMFRTADGGTLFLDEIGEMPMSLQVKLLRVLQESEVRPLGSTHTCRIDVRIVAASHRDLEKMVEQGGFRQDLYYRLAQFPIEIPPLRKRKEDILLLAQQFLFEAAARQNTPCPTFSPSVERLLLEYPFPGNVRELRSIVERAYLMSDYAALIEPEHLPDALQDIEVEASGDERGSLRERLDRIERDLLLENLSLYSGNQSATARALGLSRRTLLNKLEKYNINAHDWRV